MSEVDMPCLFDNTKRCPVRTASRMKPLNPADTTILLQNACPICPIREDMFKPKASVK